MVEEESTSIPGEAGEESMMEDGNYMDKEMFEWVLNASWKMVNEDMDDMINWSEFEKYMMWWVDLEMMKMDENWRREAFNRIDYNRDGFWQQEEVGMSMMVHEWPKEAMEEAAQRFDKMASDPKMGLSRDEADRFMDSYEGDDMKKDHHGKGHHSHSDSDGGSGGRIEIHMEEDSDGSRMSIIMEGAEKLVASSIAIAAMAAIC